MHDKLLASKNMKAIHVSALSIAMGGKAIKRGKTVKTAILQNRKVWWQWRRTEKVATIVAALCDIQVMTAQKLKKS